MIDNTEKTDTKQLRGSVDELLTDASPERLQAAVSLFSLSDEKAVIYGDALSLIIDADYNIATMRQAMQEVKDQQGLDIVRTRTKARVFKYLMDEDNPENGFVYRAFYVKTITPEQKIALGVGQAEKLKEMLGTSMVGEDFTKNPEKILEFINSEAFTVLLTEPNKIMRKVIKENAVEVEVKFDGVLTKPLVPASMTFDKTEEFIYKQLEEDLAALIEQQGIMGKNLSMTGI